MSNKRYGSLTALRFVNNGKNGARWECKCDCGREKIVDGYLLRRGSVKTCGCRININANLIGSRYGKLIVLKEAGRHKDRSILWECKCDCGKTVAVKAKSLKSGETKSCGCLRKIEKGKASLKRVYRGYKNEALRKNLQFDLSIKDFEEITTKNCFYCGVKPKQRSYRKFSNGEYLFNGIDRVDNSKGYVKGNIKPCCFICNRAKGNMEYKEFVLWLKKIKKKQF